MAALFLAPLLLLSVAAVVLRARGARRFASLLADARVELAAVVLPPDLEGVSGRGGLDARGESVVRALLVSRGSLAQAFDDLPVPLWSVDVSGACVYCNQAWMHFIGDTRTRVTGDGWWRSVHPDDLARRRAVLLDAVQMGTPFAAECRLLSSDGRYHRVRECGIPVFGRDGSLTGMVATCLDLQPGIDVAEAALARAAGVAARAETLIALNRELETFAYTVSHDLKVPLRAIDGYSHLLLTDHADQLDREGREFLACIRTGVGRMATLIDDLLSYSRTERNALRLHQIALGDVVEAVLAERSAGFDSARARIEIDVRDILVTADRACITQVMRNLIDNALKYSCNAAPQQVSIVAAYQHDKVCISVRDNGMGFDMAHADRIFNVFTRLHREGDLSGSGIGLAIVRKAMQRMGGRVWAEGAPGKGACFHLELPR
jgi:PAS domain S-box-containing protein